MTTKHSNPETKNLETTETTVSSPFNFGDASTASAQSRKLDYTPALISLSNSRAVELISTASQKPELHVLANRMLDGDIHDLLELIDQTIGQNVAEDSKILNGATDDELARLLESRRSDRSKAKAKGLRSNISVTRTYVSSMYAELLVRAKTGKAYTGDQEKYLDLASADKQTLDKKIASLQSKASRMRKLAQYDPAAKSELKAVEAEIARINQFRPNSRQNVVTVVSGASVEQLRAAIAGLSEEEQKELQDLMAKLG